jgi:hypothetical protein
MNQLDKYLSFLFCAVVFVVFPEKIEGLAVNPGPRK